MKMNCEKHANGSYPDGGLEVSSFRNKPSLHSSENTQENEVDSGLGVLLDKVLYGEIWPRGPTPFDRNGTPFVYLSYLKMYVTP